MVTTVSGQRELLVEVKVSAVEEDRLGHGVPPVFSRLRYEQALGAPGARLPPLDQRQSLIFAQFDFTFLSHEPLFPDHLHLKLQIKPHKVDLATIMSKVWSIL